MNVGLLTSESHDKACPIIRVLSPLTTCHQKNTLTLVPLGDLNKGPVYMDFLQSLHVLVVQRGLPGILSFSNLTKLLKKPRPKIVYEIDDALTHIPLTNPHYFEISPLKQPILQYITAADLVTVSTLPLKELYTPFNKNIAVLPNYLDMNIWEPFPTPPPKGPFTILISGTNTHSHDSSIISQVLSRLLEQYQGKIKLIQFGVSYEKVSTHPQVVTIPAVSNYREYARILKTLPIDLALIPLEDIPFNQAKSNIKWLEYSICRIPGIFSSIPPYSTSIQQEKTGILVENTLEAWNQAIETSLNNPQGLKEIAANAYNEVIQRYSLKDHAHEWLEVYQPLVPSHTQNQKTRTHEDPVKKDLTQNTGEKWYRKILTFKGVTADYRSTAYIRLGELAGRNGKRQWKSYFSKAIEVLKAKKHKTYSQYYRIASSYKMIGDLERAIRYFKKILSSPLPPSLASGTYFHLGEIYLIKKEPQKARQMFTQCLEMNPHHEKARQYISEIEYHINDNNSDNNSDNAHFIVSIIIPVFNKFEYTRTCLDTLYKNTNPSTHFQVIVVDNGSTDSTPDFLKEARNKWPNLYVVVNETNLGFAKACNQGARAAVGKYLLFLNNDTEPQPNWLSPMVALPQKDQTIAVVGCKLLYPDRTIQHAGVIFINDLRLNTLPEPTHIYLGAPEFFPPANDMKTFQAVTAACLLVRKELFQELAGFDTTFCNGYEDIDLCLRIHEKGLQVVYQPQSVVIHHESKSGIDRHVNDKENYDYFHKKWRGKLISDYSRDSNRPFKLAKQSPVKTYYLPRTASLLSPSLKENRLLSIKNLSPDFISNQYFYLGEQYQQQGREDAASFYKKALFFLNQVKEKNIFQLYKLASIYKRLKRRTEAIAHFKIVFNEPRFPNLKAGASFHLGELYWEQQEFDEAQTFFHKCLAILPHHREAQRFLEQISKRKEV